MLSYDQLSKKPLLFKSFAGLTVQGFDGIHNKKIAKRYGKHEMQCLSCERKDVGERKAGAGRPFKLDFKDRFKMILVYYRLYITYTLAGFLFGLYQSSICRDIQKIEALVRKCVPIPQNIHNRLSKKLKTPREVEQYYFGFLAFIDCIKQITRPADNKRKKTFYFGRKKRHTVKTQLLLTIVDLSSIKQVIGKEEDMSIYSIYKNNHFVTPKQIVNVFDLGYTSNILPMSPKDT